MLIGLIGEGRPEAYRLVFFISFLLGLVAAALRQVMLAETLHVIL